MCEGKARDHGRADGGAGRVADPEVLSLIKRLASQGVAVLVVSHNLNDVFAVAEPVVILYLGNMVAQGPVSDFDPTTVVDYMTTGRTSRTVDHAAVPRSAGQEGV